MTDRFVCSDASERRDEGVVATASQVRGWLLVEVHGAWGVDAVHESHLGAHVPEGWKAGLQRRGIRPICIRPAARAEDPGTARVFFVVAARPGRTQGAVWSRTLPTLSAVPYVTDELRLGQDPHGWERHADRLVLVCTNGKHDQCCANRGRPVVRHLRDSRWADQVWECSHIGGDRFAANLVVLPDSLYFGRMEPVEAEALLDAHDDGQLALEWFRGRSTLRFAEQAAEHALRTALDVRGVDDVVIAPSDQAERVRAHVRGIGTIDVLVQTTVARSDEPLTCHGTPDQVVPSYFATELIEVAADPGPAPAAS
ncbi:sucrase ferredoxin [Aquihabitans sp. McL0605]|uniref:sucrase ferredoxin n=1 Tax=Aquihabitans sp. McL0605 TaxID=3415671 RepID=UPI003CEF2C01